MMALASPARSQDLNGNLVPDSQEIRAGATDCNRNGVPDAVDISRPHFTSAIEHLNGVEAFQNNTWELCPIDFNRDGRPDLAICTFYSTNYGRITLWRNAGGPGLVFHGQIDFPDARPTVIRSGDVNGDGRADLVAADSSYNQVYVMLATGDGVFAPAVTLTGDPSNNGSVGVALGDLDGDGDLDIACTSWGTNKVNIFLNNGAGIFGPRASYPTDFQPRDVAIGDFTGDGLNDLAIANEYYSPTPASANGTVTLLRNIGGGAFTTHATIAMPTGNAPYGYQARPQFVELVDVDHDGDMDLITSSKLANTLAIHRNDGAGNFALAQRFGGTAIEGNARDVRLADLDGDGWEEIVWGDTDMSRAAVYRNNHGTFEFVQSYGTATFGSLYLAIADFSGDGRPDIVTANDAARTFSVLVNRGGLVFDAPAHLRPDDFPSSAMLADFTSDGRTDFAVIRQNSAGTQFTASVYPGIGGGLFNWTAIDTPLSGSASALARDLNADGRQDLLLVNTQTEVRLGNGDGTFSAPIVSAIAPVWLRLVIADFNRDGFPDLAWIVAGHPGVVRVSLGDGAGRFGPYTQYTVLAEDESIAAGDITGDGAPEILCGFRQQAAPPAGGVLSWLPNNGDGTFGARQDRFIVESPLSPAVGAIAVADFDGDGDRDVIVSANGLKLFRNPGNGVLPATWEQISQASASILAAADIDLDGDIDLYGRATTGIVYLNSGNGQFESPMFLHRYDSNARTMVVADADNDGRPDLMIGPENSWAQYLWLNHPPASIDANHNGVPDECDPAPSCPADFDGNGVVQPADIAAFVAAWYGGLSSGSLAADFNHDGSITPADIAAFVAAWFVAVSGGCV